MLSMACWRWYVLGVLDPVSQLPVWAYQLPGSMDTFGLGMLGAVIHVQYSEQRERFAQYRKWLMGLLCLTRFIFFLAFGWLINTKRIGLCPAYFSCGPRYLVVRS
jgi:hypothetical protein